MRSYEVLNNKHIIN